MHSIEVTQRGFHFLESLIVILIIGIISSFALPAYSSLIESQHRHTTLHSLHHLVALARSEAIKRNKHVVICPSRNAISCEKTKDYSRGWIMFENTDQKYPAQRNADEALIDFNQAQKNAFFDIYANRYAFTFRPINKRNTNGTFITCPNTLSNINNHKYQSVVISFTGRPRIENIAQTQHHKICP